ncbi:MAG: hypothetical protein SGBAC_004609 [Bacillariaceae sp.]
MARNQQAAAAQVVRPTNLYLGCSTRVRLELLRVIESDRRAAFNDVWTQLVAEAPTQQELDQQQNNNDDGQPGGGNANNHNHNNHNNHNLVIPVNANLMEFLNGSGNNHEDGIHNGNTDHDIREIMEQNIKKHRFRPAYYKVQFLNPTYSANLDLFKLCYKRHAGNPKLAAQQFCRFWDLKLQYFGLEQLCKPLTLKALSSQDKACLYNGCLQLSRDDYGRTVLYLLPSLLTVEQANGYTPKKEEKSGRSATTNGNGNGNGDGDGDGNGNGNGNGNNPEAEQEDEASKLACPHLVRAMWYLIFRALQDKGETNMVILLLGQDKDDLFGKAILHCTSVLREALPFNVVALHYLDGPGMSTIDEDESNNQSGGHNANSNRNNENNFLWDRQQPQNNQDDQHGFGGLEQVAEWGGAVEVPDHQLPQDNLPLHHEGHQDEQQQLRLLENSNASLEHLEDRVGRNVRLRLRFHSLFQLQVEDLLFRSYQQENAETEEDKDKEDDDEKDPFGILHRLLARFGIPDVPLNNDGTLIMHNPIDSSSKRFFFTRPEHTLPNNLILPTTKDVLLGKGRPYQEHPGNIALNDIIDKYRDEYTGCKSRTEKTAMSLNILDTIKNQGGRFLMKKSKDDDLWVVASELKAREKVAHSFRMPRKFLKEAIKEKRRKEEEERQARNGAAETQQPPPGGQPEA